MCLGATSGFSRERLVVDGETYVVVETYVMLMRDGPSSDHKVEKWMEEVQGTHDLSNIQGLIPEDERANVISMRQKWHDIWKRDMGLESGA